jgi:hypothetical protein
MAFLTINGFTISASTTGVSYSREAIGARTTAYSGQAQPNRRSVIRTFDISTPVASVAEQEAVSGLLQGDGHKWSMFSSLYSSKGLAPNTGYNVTMVPGGTGVTGANTGFVTVASNTSLSWTILQYGGFTLLVYKYVGAAWVQYAYVFDGATATQYKNGAPHTPVAGDTMLNWFAYTASVGLFEIKGKNIDGTNAASNYDEMVLVPYAMTEAMVAAFHANTFTNQIPFSELPTLMLSGDMIPVPNQLFVGSVVSGSYEPALVAAGNMIAKTVSCTLTEFAGRNT